jgi:phosphomannomutase
MFKIVAEWNGEVLAEKPTYDEAIIEAAEQAEHDDIMVVVIDPDGDEVYFVDGFSDATDLLHGE